MFNFDDVIACCRVLPKVSLICELSAFQFSTIVHLGVGLYSLIFWQQEREKKYMYNKRLKVVSLNVMGNEYCISARRFEKIAIKDSKVLMYMYMMRLQMLK